MKEFFRGIPKERVVPPIDSQAKLENTHGIPRRALLRLGAVVGTVLVVDGVAAVVGRTLNSGHVSSESFSSADAAENKRIAERIDSQEGGSVEGFLDTYVNSAGPNSFVVTPDRVRINKDRAKRARFSKEGSIYVEEKPLFESKRTFAKDGALLSTSLTTTRFKVDLPEINRAIDSEIADGGLYNPELRGLYERLLRETFRLPKDAVCYTGTMEDTKDGKQVGGLYVYSVKQIGDTEWDISVQIGPSGKVNISVYDQITTTCGIN